MYKLPCPDNVLYLGSVGKAATSQAVGEVEVEGGEGGEGGAEGLNKETAPRGQEG